MLKDKLLADIPYFYSSIETCSVLDFSFSYYNFLLSLFFYWHFFNFSTNKFPFSLIKSCSKLKRIKYYSVEFSYKFFLFFDLVGIICEKNLLPEYIDYSLFSDNKCEVFLEIGIRSGSYFFYLLINSLLHYRSILSLNN